MAAELLHALETRDATQLAALLDAQPELLVHVFDDDDAPNDLGRGRTRNGPLHLAAYYGDEAVLDLLLERGVDPERRNAEGRTALHIALEHNIVAARHLVARNVLLDIVAASCLQRLDRMRALLDEDPSLANDDSTMLSPLGWACYHGAADAARLLIEAGARMDDGELRCCAGVGRVEMGRILLDEGADVNERCAEDGSTALHVAAAHLHTDDASEFVRLLLDAGADRSLTAGPEQISALELAERRAVAQKEAGIGPGHECYCRYDKVIELLST